MMFCKKGFTLIELLVVISIIALLLAILMPSLNMVKQKASSAVCLVNSKNLALGWFMYKEDNNGRIVSATMESREGNGTNVGWIGLPRKEDGTIIPHSALTSTSITVSDEDEIRGIKAGALYSYLEDPGVYHCPGDNKRRSLFDGTKLFTTYQIPGCLYGYPNTGHNYYSKQIRRFSEVRRPSEKYVFVECAEMRNWNSNGRFLLAAPEYGYSEWAWWVPVAVNHGDSSILGFCDGHAETRKWRNQSTKDHINKLIEHGGTGYGAYVPEDGMDDLDYMVKGWAYR